MHASIHSFIYSHHRYIKKSTGQVTSAFADLVEAENSNAAGVFNAVTPALEGVGLGQEPQKKLIMVSLDGAPMN